MNDEKADLEAVRTRLVCSHETMRDALAALDLAAGRLEVNHDELQSTIELQKAIERLCALANDHLDLEETCLLPLLRTLGWWDGRRTDDYLEDHRQQRDVICALHDESVSGCKLGDALADDARWVARSIGRSVLEEEALLRGLEIGVAATVFLIKPLANPWLAAANTNGTRR